MSDGGLTLRDKLALIYTLAGSQRRVAAFVGISHQKVGRLLKPYELGGYAPSSRVPADPDLNAAINAAFSIYKDFARRVANAHGLPFIDAVPIYTERLALSVMINGKKYLRVDKNGNPVLGDRVAALRTHWISDEMRRAWIAAIAQTGFFNNLSIRSTVDLQKYFDAAEERLEGKRGGEKDRRWVYRAQLQRKLQLGQTIGHIFTPYQALNRTSGIPFNPTLIINAVEAILRARHEHCALALSDEYLLQVDSRQHGKQARYQTKPGTARGNQAGNRSRARDKRASSPTRARTPRKKAPRKGR
jgi:hypothetical protein